MAASTEKLSTPMYWLNEVGGIEWDIETAIMGTWLKGIGKADMWGLLAIRTA